MERRARQMPVCVSPANEQSGLTYLLTPKKDIRLAA